MTFFESRLTVNIFYYIVELFEKERLMSTYYNVKNIRARPSELFQLKIESHIACKIFFKLKLITTLSSKKCFSNNDHRQSYNFKKNSESWDCFAPSKCFREALRREWGGGGSRYQQQVLVQTGSILGGWIMRTEHCKRNALPDTARLDISRLRYVKLSFYFLLWVSRGCYILINLCD